MADIELIPRDYLAMRLLRQRLLRFAVLVGLIVGLTLVGRAWLGWRLATDRPLVDALRQSEKTASERQSRLLAMQARKSDADAQLVALRALRNGAGWEAVFRAVDAAHNSNLWFDGLSYQREARIEPAAGAKPTATETPALRHSFEIQGHALTHAAITDFMRSLGEQPGISGVRLAETGLGRAATVDIVDFKLTGLLDPNRKPTP